MTHASYDLPTHIVTDPVSNRELYVHEDSFNEALEFCDGDVEKAINHYFTIHAISSNLASIRNRVEIDELIEFANKVRKTGEAEIIDDLLLSTPQDSNGCLIAKTLNFGGCVSNDYGDWAMTEINEDLAVTIAEELGLDTVTEKYFGGLETIGVYLPDNIADVAHAFDSYADVELEKYDSYRSNNTENPL